MIVTTGNGIVEETLVTRQRSTVTFEKILKRWYLVARFKGEDAPRKIAVKHVTGVYTGRNAMKKECS